MTPTSVQANHTSAVGQVEAVNFTIIPTTMAAGCHIQVRHAQVLQVCWLLWGGADWNVSLKFAVQNVPRLRVLPCLRPGSACSITAPTTATFAMWWKVGVRRQSRVHADWQSQHCQTLYLCCPHRKWTHQSSGLCWIHQRVAVSGIRHHCLQVVSSVVRSVFGSLTPQK